MALEIMSISFVLLIGLLITMITIIRIKLIAGPGIKKQATRFTNYPPGTFGWPLIGESLQFISSYRSHTDPDRFIDDRRSRHGLIFTTHLFGKPTVVSLDPEVNRFVLNSDGRLFVPEYPTSLKELWGRWAILMLKGTLHKRVHGIVASLLKSHDFKDDIGDYVQHCIQMSMAKWTSDKPVYVEEETKQISFNVTMKFLLGLNAGATTEAFRVEFHKFINGVVSLPIKFPGTTFFKSLQAKRKMVEMIEHIANEREKQSNYCTTGAHCIKERAQDILGVLLEERRIHGKTIPFELISDNIVSFLFPAEDSVAMLMTLVVKYISECPEALVKIQEENLNLMKRSNGEKLTWRQYLSQLPFTHNVLRETLRMGNIAKGVIRKALVDVPIKDFVIPKGWAVFPLFRGVHLDETLYKDANTFNPWRWEGITSGMHYTPFGGGPRYCAGIDIALLEAVVFLHNLVTRFKWVLLEQDTVTHFPFVKLAKKLPIRVERLSEI